MSQWLDTALARAERVEDWLRPKRQTALSTLRETPWPTRKTEAWRFTPLRDLEKAQFDLAPAGEFEKPAPIEGLDSIDLVFANGRFRPDLSSGDLPDGVHLQSFAAAQGEEQKRIAELFASIKPRHHLFGLVNDVLATDGLYIQIAEGARIERPLRVVQLMGEGAEAHQRILVHLGRGAGVRVVEQLVGNVSSFNTSFAEYRLEPRARLEHYRFALQGGEAMAMGGSHFHLGGESELNSTVVGFGSKLSRLDTDIIHGGEHAHAKLNAIYLLKGQELFDLHATVEHAEPHGTTEENVRGIVADRAHAVFNGRIHIHRHAQKTVAELNNRNLLLSDRATVNTKPELEIYADDVRCAHGATVAEMDEAALYYLQTRGLERRRAQVMLNFGFINALVAQMPNEALAEWLRPQLRERFAVMEVD